MTDSHIRFWVFGLLLIAGVGGCSPAAHEPAASTDRDEDPIVDVFVVNYPLQYFAERIGGSSVRVQCPVPPQTDPAYWMPDPETIADYQRADLILLNGADYARWTSKATLPESRICETSAEFRDEYIEIDDAVTHSHGPEGEHAHGGTAATIWLDPQLAIRQAEAICTRLEQLRPQAAAEFRENLAGLREDLQELDAELKQLVTSHPDLPLIASHPVYQYLERRYRLNLTSVHWEPHEAPTAAMWDELGERLQEHPAGWMLWEGPPLAETVSRLREKGIESIVFDPCGNVPDAGDYLTVQRANLDNLRAVFAP